MTALAANKEITEKVAGLQSVPVAVDIIYKGALCKVNADGFLAPCAAEAGSVFAGVAMESVDNSAGSAGDLECTVKDEGVFLLLAAGMAQANVGDLIYATDDQLVTVTEAANLQIVGRIVRVDSATQIWVKLMDEGVVLGS